ncbi:cysteine desulfurase [Aidingimonas halophila]|uniref:cysteine desulfurase n=2 Tax=Aidingimonas halophila TaxID=574349 RepID=A0A1H2ZQG6_9GAMM|nr:cysteine desulfurase IscS [Aidingimonas halophila]SDX19511.1 cysteine desulfurase [Aidingimonas halophila]
MRVGSTIYMDYQATTPVDKRVVEAMRPYFEESFGNPHSSDHILGWRSQQAIESAQAQIAHSIGGDPDEIFFTSGATEANNLAVLGLSKGQECSRDRILVSAVEHKCVLSAARAAETDYDMQVDQIPVDTKGHIDLAALDSMLDSDVLLVSVMAVNNEIGTVQDLDSIAEIVHKYGALFHSDAAQALEALDIDVRATGIDLMSLSAHKVYGPKGIGALYVARESIGRLRPIIQGGGQQLGVRPGTVPTPLCVGFAKAIELCGDHGERERQRWLNNWFVERLRDEGVVVEVNGSSLNQRHPGNINICFDGVDAHSFLGSLQPFVCASTGSACTSGIIESSHVLAAIGVPEEKASSAVRFSIGRYSDQSQLDEVVQHISAAVFEYEPGACCSRSRDSNDM